MINVSQLLEHRYEHLILATMLLALALALLSDFGSALSASLITVHFGLFFLWQPIWQRDQSLDVASSIFTILFVGVFVALLNWWLMFFWLILLIGIVAGRSFHTRRERFLYMTALTFLISVLLIECVPRVFAVSDINPAIGNTFRVAWLALPVALAFVPIKTPTQRETFPVDFFRGVLIALITALLAVSSVLLTYQNELDYPVALIGALLAVSTFLLAISWMFSPSGGGGLGALWEKSVLNIGTPFESWLSNLARLSEAEAQPSRFLDAAIRELTTMPWVAGAKWRFDDQSGSDGTSTGYQTSLASNELNITLYTERPVGSSLLLHCRLLIELLGQFHNAKLRELENADQAHLQAVHETGARLTHDIKNLLQTLKTTTAAIADDHDDDEARRQQRLALLQRQLPHISQRLQLALDKLQRPPAQQATRMAASEWWQQFCQRHAGESHRFEAEISDDVQIPGECFDSVVENLLDNTRSKAQTHAGLEVAVRLRVADGSITLSVSDDGRAIDDNTARQVFKRPISSDNGLGIGLYQASQQASNAGYELALVENRDGCVRFELRTD